MSTELKECPFCGGDAEYFETKFVRCSNANCFQYDMGVTADGWNHRANRDQWISVADDLPKERASAYQVLVACNKPQGGMYEGMCVRRYVQDWVVRSWPDQFVAWMYDPVGHFRMPAPPEAP